MQDIEVKMPDLSTTGDSVRLVKWLAQAGEEIKIGQPLCEIETDKATMEVESVAAGVIAKLLVPEDAEVKVGQVIAVVQSRQQGQREEAAGSKKEGAAISDKEERSEDTVREVVPSKPRQGLFARNKQKAGVTAAEGIRLSNTQMVVAKRMQQSKQTVPHFYLQATAGADAMVAVRKKAGEQTPPRKVVWDAFFVRAVAAALEKHERMKCRFEDNQLIQSSTDAVGVAADIDDDLYVLAIKGALTKGLYEISEEILARVERIRKGDADAKKLEPANITITNLGSAGVDSFFAIVNPPEAAILAIGKVAGSAGVVDGRLAVRQEVKLTLSVDHRVVSGKYAANFLHSIVGELESMA